ncbi:TPA: hypothetical protein ACY4P8_004690 [Vibrio parahaemolyticus]
MFDVGAVGNIASILGFFLAIAIALYQRDIALKAEREAKSEREKAATLEDHLMRQRWQQLRSLGEQIDQIERENSHISDPASAALHARLKEQYASILGVLTVSTPNFSVALIRRWVSTGRLFRTWQISEALTYVNANTVDKETTEDEKWLREVISLTNASSQPHPQNIKLPIELNEFVAAYILLSRANHSFIKAQLNSGKNKYSLTTVLGYLSHDCIEKMNAKYRHESLKCWGWDKNKTFEERYAYYQKLDFWIVCTVSDYFQSTIREYSDFFEDIGAHPKCLLSTSRAVDEAKELFPELYTIVQELFPNEQAEVSSALSLAKI